MGLTALATVFGEPLFVLPAIAAFEVLVVPRLARAAPPTIGPLRPWDPPESYRESPEAPARWALRGQ